MDIANWLRNNPVPARMSEEAYSEGLRLLGGTFRKHLVPRLGRKPCSAAKKRLLHAQLRYVLVKLSAARPVAARPAGGRTPAPDASAPASSPRPDVSALPAKDKIYCAPWTEIKVSRLRWELFPDVLKAEYFRKGKLFVLAAVAHRKLLQANFGRDPRDLAETQRERNAAYAAEILGNLSEVDKIWKKIDHYLLHGELPPEPSPAREEEPLDLEQVSRRLRIRQSNLCTYRSRMRTADPARKEKYQAKIQALEEEIRTLARQREMLKNARPPATADNH